MYDEISWQLNAGTQDFQRITPFLIGLGIVFFYYVTQFGRKYSEPSLAAKNNGSPLRDNPNRIARLGHQSSGRS